MELDPIARRRAESRLDDAAIVNVLEWLAESSVYVPTPRCAH
ncbi:MAG: hypothetical protein QOI28_2087 [Mycobacterium sp.]|jgi:hypothetical protein|nr:hypothetical protein [Mycobacterium sp.]